MALILAIESSTSAIGISLGDAQGSLVSLRSGGPSRHAEMLVPAVQWCLSQSNLEMANIAGIAIDVGPGLFTGLRVGIASAKAFAFALQVPLVAKTSLEVLAWPHRWREGIVATIVDARRGQCFWAAYRCGGGGCVQIHETEVATPDHVRTSLHELALEESISGASSRLGNIEEQPDESANLGRNILLVGDGAVRYWPVLHEGAPFVSWAGSYFRSPDPEALLEMTVGDFESGNTQDVSELAPLYMREPDAKANWTASTSVR